MKNPVKALTKTYFKAWLLKRKAQKKSAGICGDMYHCATAGAFRSLVGSTVEVLSDQVTLDKGEGQTFDLLSWQNNFIAEADKLDTNHIPVKDALAILRKC